LTFDLIDVLRDLNQKYHKKAAEPGCFGAIYMDIHLTKPLDEAKMINALKQRIAERSAVKLRNDL